jgi:hypothetical protein
VVATVRRRLSRSKKGKQKFDMERFDLQKLNAEIKSIIRLSPRQFWIIGKLKLEDKCRVRSESL